MMLLVSKRPKNIFPKFVLKEILAVSITKLHEQGLQLAEAIHIFEKGEKHLKLLKDYLKKVFSINSTTP